MNIDRYYESNNDKSDILNILVIALYIKKIINI